MFARTVMRRRVGYIISEMTNEELAEAGWGDHRREDIVNLHVDSLMVLDALSTAGTGFYFMGERIWVKAVKEPAETAVEEPATTETELAKKARLYAAAVTKLQMARREEAEALTALKEAMNKGERA